MDLSFLEQLLGEQIEEEEGPVSYTHLDVYKRQIEGTTRSQQTAIAKSLLAARGFVLA